MSVVSPLVTVRASVSAEIDFSQVMQTAEAYRPNQGGDARAGAASRHLEFDARVLAHVDLRPFLSEYDHCVRAFDRDLGRRGRRGHRR